MNIDLIKIKFNESHSYKYKPIKYCCTQMTYSQNIIKVCTGDFCTGLYIRNCSEPKYCIVQERNHDSTYYPIQLCPYCGEKINIRIIDEKDLSQKYNELSTINEELNNKLNKNLMQEEEVNLKNQISDLEKCLNDFYKIDELDPNKMQVRELINKTKCNRIMVVGSWNLMPIASYDVIDNKLVIHNSQFIEKLYDFSCIKGGSWNLLDEDTRLTPYTQVVHVKDTINNDNFKISFVYIDR